MAFLKSYFILFSFVFTYIQCQSVNIKKFNLIEKKEIHPGINEKSICEEKILEILKFNFKDERFNNMVMYSGFILNDLGDYRRCQDKNITHYFFIGSIPTIQIGLGLCLPKECTSFSVNNLILKYAIPILKILKKNTSFPIKVIDPQLENINYKKEQKTFEFYLGIGFLLLISSIVLILSIYSIILQYFLKVKKQNHNLSNLQKLINCVPISNNIRSLFRSENRLDPNLEALNILRVICIFWIVAGHCLCFYEQFYPLNLISTAKHIQDSNMYVIIRNATVSVDAFFFLSGFLSTLSFGILFDKKEQRKVSTILLSYVNRYFRLIPFVFVILIIEVFYVPFCQDGPVIFPYELSANFCKTKLLPMFLLISNFAQSNSNFCNLWQWYLYVDWELFLITPFIILLYIKSHRLGLILLSSLALLSFSYQVIFFQIKKYDAAMSKQDYDFGQYYYVQPYARCNTYFIGIIFCLIYLSSPKRKMSSFVSSSLNSLNLLIEVRYIRYILFLGGCFLSIFFIFAENFFDHSPTKQPQVYCTLFLLFYRI